MSKPLGENCVDCGGSEQIVKVEGVGLVCRHCYPRIKRRRAQPQEVKTVYCENCHGSVIIRGRCIQCGQHVSADGSMMRM